MEIISGINELIMLLIAAKAIIIGSDFSCYQWFKHGKVYTDWYWNRPKFKVVE